MNSFLDFLHENFFWWVLLCLAFPLIKGVCNSEDRNYKRHLKVKELLKNQREIFQQQVDQGVMSELYLEIYDRRAFNCRYPSDVKELAKYCIADNKDLQASIKKKKMEEERLLTPHQKEKIILQGYMQRREINEQTQDTQSAIKKFYAIIHKKVELNYMYPEYQKEFLSYTRFCQNPEEVERVAHYVLQDNHDKIERLKA